MHDGAGESTWSQHGSHIVHVLFLKSMHAHVVLQGSIVSQAGSIDATEFRMDAPKKAFPAIANIYVAQR